MGFLDNTGLARVWSKITTALGGKVDKTTTVNGHALSGNVSVTKRDVGLGNVNNTSDANKPISTATQTALNGKVSTSTTVNGHALSSNVSVTQQDIGIKYSSTAPSNPSDGDIWLQPESASNILHDTDIASSAITGKSTVNAALAQLNSDVSNLNGQNGSVLISNEYSSILDAVNAYRYTKAFPFTIQKFNSSVFTDLPGNMSGDVEWNLLCYGDYSRATLMLSRYSYAESIYLRTMFNGAYDMPSWIEFSNINKLMGAVISNEFSSIMDAVNAYKYTKAFPFTIQKNGNSVYTDLPSNMVSNHEWNLLCYGDPERMTLILSGYTDSNATYIRSIFQNNYTMNNWAQMTIN